MSGRQGVIQQNLRGLSDSCRGDVDFDTIYRGYNTVFHRHIVVLNGKYQRARQHEIRPRQ